MDIYSTYILYIQESHWNDVQLFSSVGESDFCNIFTSTAEGGRRLCAGHLKKLWTDSYEILWVGWLCDKDELFRLLVNIRIRIQILELFSYLSDSSPLRDEAKNDV